jgi:hypothetical protein
LGAGSRDTHPVIQQQLTSLFSYILAHFVARSSETFSTMPNCSCNLFFTLNLKSFFFETLNEVSMFNSMPKTEFIVTAPLIQSTVI